MPSIRIANGDLFDPWNPSIKGHRDTPTWDWLGHHLANECRYAGGCKWYYSVAQHSVLVCREIMSRTWAGPKTGSPGILQMWNNRRLGLAALLHDCSESVLKDIPGPYKHSKGSSVFKRYNKLESELTAWFYDQFDLGEAYLNAPPIKAIDKELLDAERSKLFPDANYKYSGTIVVEPWDREYARDEFNSTLRSLAHIDK
jgi:uncharacterized protein